MARPCNRTPGSNAVSFGLNAARVRPTAAEAGPWLQQPCQSGGVGAQAGQRREPRQPKCVIGAKRGDPV